MVNGLLNTLVAFLIGGATLSFNFTAADAAGNVQYASDGTVITLGENYRIELPQVIVVSDGITRGIYQKEIDEIVFQKVLEGNAGASMVNGPLQAMLDNPLALIRDAEKYYTVTAWKGGKKFTPQTSGALPDKIELRTKGGETYTILINGLRKNESVDKITFTLNPDDYPTAVVTDLR